MKKFLFTTAVIGITNVSFGEIADLYNWQLGSLNSSSSQTQSAPDSYPAR
jgi:hypothetical protein